MVIVTLLLQDMRTGERMTAEFPTLDSCADWLRERPKFIDVLGPTHEPISPEGDKLLRASLRPYDDEEQAMMRETQAKPDDLVAQVTAAMAEQMRQAQEKERERIANLGPNDPMTVIWEQGGTVTNAEPLDTRPVPAAVVDALTEWITERNSWVQDRGQTVRSAQVTAWPGEIPSGGTRIQRGGQFELE